MHQPKPPRTPPRSSSATASSCSAAALVFVLLFRRLGLGAVLGYLVAGALVGPHGLGLVGAADEMLHIADLGIVLLLFLVGLELHPERLWRLQARHFRPRPAPGDVDAAWPSPSSSMLQPASARAASLAIGLPLALSSTAQVLPSLRADGSINTPFGERAFSILLFQDLSIVPLITIIAALSRAPADPSAPPGWQLAVYTIGAIVGLVLAGRFLINPLFRLVGRISERELFVVAGLFIVLASAAVMEALHLSTALGAFIAGVMLADSPYRHELEADVDPFRSILLGLFFLAVGMMLDLGRDRRAAPVRDRHGRRPDHGEGDPPVRPGPPVPDGNAACGQARPAAEPGRRVRLRPVRAAANQAMLISPEAASLFGAIVTVSMATTPFLMMFNDWLDRRSTRNDGAGLDGPELSDKAEAIVVGYGRFGQTVAQMLMAKGIRVTLIDSTVEP